MQAFSSLTKKTKCQNFDAICEAAFHGGFMHGLMVAIKEMQNASPSNFLKTCQLTLAP